MAAGNSKKTAPGTPFPKGKSGNLNGRPKVVEEFRARARSAVDSHVLDAWVREVVEQGPEWVRCSELLAAYGYCKPPQAKEDNDAMRAANPFASLTVEQLVKLASSGE